MNNEYLIKMLDGGLVDIETDQDQAWSGCETCDYGSKYVTEVDLELSKYKMHIQLGNMYEPPSIDYLIKMLIRVDIIQSMTEKEFIDYVKNAIEQFYDEKALRYEPEISVVERGK